MRALRIIFIGSLVVFGVPAARGGEKQDLPSGAIRSFGTAVLRDGYVNALDVSPDGKLLLVGGSGRLRVWNLAERRGREVPLHVGVESSASEKEVLEASAGFESGI